jgi:hypothetical protein
VIEPERAMKTGIAISTNRKHPAKPAGESLLDDVQVGT